MVHSITTIPPVPLPLSLRQLVVQKLSLYLSYYLVEMDRPRRAAAQKPEAHYATSSHKSQIKEDAMSSDVPTTAPPSATVPAPVIVLEPLGPASLALDLNKSYEGQIPTPTLPKRQTRWKQPATNPIVNLMDMPKGWNSNEPDLDPKYVFHAISIYMDNNIYHLVI